MLGVILLAAGLSKRMGAANKLLLPWGNHTVLTTTLEALLAADIGRILVVLGHESAQIEALLRGYPVDCIYNPDYAQGMTSSIQAGIRHQAEAEGWAVCLSDMPRISSDDYRQLAAYFKQCLKQDPLAIVQPRFEGRPGNPTLFSAAHRSALLTHTAPEGCREIVQAQKKHVFSLDLSHNGIHQDIDTADDYANIRPIIGE